MIHVVITGGTRGIGKALAEAFLRKGCHVTLTGRDRAVAEKVAGELISRSDNPACRGLPCEVTRMKDLQQLWNTASALQQVDIWINNAGINHPSDPLDRIDPEKIREVLDVNITGTVWGTHTAFRGMKSQGSGFIYNMEGFGSDGRTLQGISIYGTSKRAVRYFTRSMEKELKDSPVRIGSISPGMVVTDLLVSPLQEQNERKDQALKIFHILADRPERVAPWLATRILRNTKHGKRIAWLTGRKIAWRFFTSLFRKRKVEGLEL